MPRYSIGFVSSATASGAAIATIEAPTRNLYVVEIGVFCNAATASGVSLFRNTASGEANNAASSAGQPFNPPDVAGTGIIGTGWSTAPTITAASRIRRGQLPATIGAGLIWTFPTPMLIRNATKTDYLVLWNESGSTNSVLNGYVTWDE
jgi:hypothetical protein